jgi:hypothetical protein
MCYGVVTESWTVKAALRYRAAPCMSLLGLIWPQSLSLGAGVSREPWESELLCDRANMVTLRLHKLRETVRHVLRQPLKQYEPH